jgi:thiol:disulfide interchange protein
MDTNCSAYARGALRHALLSLALLLAVAAPAVAQGWQHASAQLYTRAEGSALRAVVVIEIEPGWHLYHTELGPPDAIGMPTTASWTPAELAMGPLLLPTPERGLQAGLGADGGDTWIWQHAGTIRGYAQGSWAEGSAHGPIALELRGLTCEDSGSCVPYSETVQSSGPGEDALFADFPKEFPAPGAAGEVAARVFEPREKAPDRSLLSALLWAFLAGVILNVMPCVLPVISIKVLSFVQQAGEDRRRVFALGLAFAAGILVVFWGLAGLAIGAQLSWGEQFQSTGFLIAMIALVFAFALSLFGVYELGVPSEVGALASSRREGLGGAFFKGALATVLATPCSGPFLGSTLAWTAAQTASVTLLVFTALGLGMALPYVVLTAQPKLLRALPRPGAWMDTFKHACGFVLLATVIFLMRSLRQDHLLATVALLVFVACGCWWWGRFATFGQSTLRRLAALGIALGIVAGGARWSLVEFQEILHPPAREDGLAWRDFDQAEFDGLIASGRSVFVDWTADWCVNCKVNEAFVFESAEVRAELERKHVVAMKADITHDNERSRALEQFARNLGSHAVPFFAIFPGDDPHRPLTHHDTVTQSRMLEMLAQCPEPEGDSASARAGE